MLDANALPEDVETLKRLLLEREAAVTARDVCLREKDRQIEHLKLQLAKLRRWKFGKSSEGLEGSEQFSLGLEEIKAVLAEVGLDTAQDALDKAVKLKIKPKRRTQFPEHFDRIDKVIPPTESTCPHCGDELKVLGKDGNADVAETVAVKTITFTVTRHIRPKKRCVGCASIVQAPAPPRPIERSFAESSLLALVLVWKYCFSLPLYRQCQMFAHARFKISRTTLMQWVAGSSQLLGPLVAALAKHVLAARNLNADDTPIKVLAPGSGRTKTGYMWTYVRDGRPWGSTDPPAVWYQYSPGRSGRYPQRHLKNYVGKLQVDAYAGFNPLFVPCKPNTPARLLEIACFAHVRRKFFDVYEAQNSPMAKEAIDRIRQLYDIEDCIRGQSPPERLAIRKKHAVPLLNDLNAWMIKTAALIDKKSALAGAFNYAFNCWEALLRYTEDGHLEIDNNIAERSVRGVGVGRKNFLFFGSDTGGERAAIIYSLVETCKLNNIDPERYLAYVLERIAQHPINRIDELLPWNVADKLNVSNTAPPALAA